MDGGFFPDKGFKAKGQKSRTSKAKCEETFSAHHRAQQNPSGLDSRWPISFDFPYNVTKAYTAETGGTCGKSLERGNGIIEKSASRSSFREKVATN